MVYYNLLFCSREPKVLSPKLNISYTESGVYLIILVAFGTIKNIDQSPNFPINRFVRFCFICQFYEIWIGATCKIPMSFRYVFPPCIASPVKLNVFPNASQLFLMFKNVFFPTVSYFPGKLEFLYKKPKKSRIISYLHDFSRSFFISRKKNNNQKNIYKNMWYEI